MFWKFVISALLLPSCLGLEVATASVQKGIKTQLNYEELGTQVAQVEDNLSTQTDWETDTEQLKHHKHRHHYKTRRSYRHRRPCSQSNRSYYRRGYHPQYIDYRRRHNDYNRYYQDRQYHPEYIYDRDIYRNPYRYNRHGRYDY
ncbi:MAG: hypothetical protein KME49_15880 [Brasilonema octagenarum HA4186-MV1]|jgi:hypothetical protein|uniref:Uncharacterized protein n=2 Tax=Brasilonema TaxID=383614 RepID=A0A856MB51_9CYAN|nr:MULTISPECIES: hypothetical protein [Brasilonema]MBW4626934.1 hypothetical protein [Brasilonema octagenarum HA4186-MV1]NMF64532.1 hypothetical protein [Brasilonema octagenarum UFV-OR1]QDL07922.1 hypothetical protein DP114_08405 [Brasilonema sennae CENA114]QDL14282.1 hypothetical protein DP113_08360 [Brasilonema octagenarum UFV-E1]